MKSLDRKRTRFARLLLLLLAYAVGGAIINVAVAWGCAAWGSQSALLNRLFHRQPQQSVWRDAPNYQGWRVLSFWSAGSRRIDSGWADPNVEIIIGSKYISWIEPYEDPEELVRGWADFLAPPKTPSAGVTGHTRTVRAYGIPMLTLWSAENADYVTMATPRAAVISHGMVVEHWTTEQWRDSNLGCVILPMGVLWPGFAINTIFYAAILWLLFAAPGFVRRRIRARRGQCPACAYPVGTNDVCTECGNAVRVRSP